MKIPFDYLRRVGVDPFQPTSTRSSRPLLKAHLRTAQERSIDAPWQCIGDLPDL